MFFNQAKIHLAGNFINPVIICFAISGCITEMGANAYNVSDLNVIQNAQLIEIISVDSAEIIDNDKGAAIFGGIIGSLAGALAGNMIGPNDNKTERNKSALGGALLGGAGGAALGAQAKKKVEGVVITYRLGKGDKAKTITQRGRVCEFKQGDAQMVGGNRILPNDTCPSRRGGRK